MLVSSYKSFVLLLLSLIFTGLLHAEPVLVFGSFTERNNASNFQRLVEVRLNRQVYLAETLVNTVSYYRVVLPTRGLPVIDLKRQAADAGYDGVWSWDASLTRGRAIAVKSKVLEADSGKQPVNLVGDERAVSVQMADKIGFKTLPEGFSDVIALDSDGTNVDILIPQIVKLSKPMIIDGRMDESIWSEVPGYDNMLVIEPDTLTDPRYKTDMRMFYTDKGLYIAAFMEQPPDTMVARLSSRDEFINRDAFGITLDTSGEGLYGYWFSVNLGGSVMDGKVAAERQFSREWDGPWTSGTAVLENGWSAEMFLPWSMMTMAGSKSGERKLGFWVNRKVAYIDERWSWPALPFASKRFMSALATMRTPDVEPKQQIAAFPYASFTVDELSLIHI